MATARLRCTSPTTSSESSPDTGNRECPVSTAAATSIASAASVALTNRTRTRGVSTSSAVLPENEIDRASRPAVGCSRVPCAADRRTSESSSTADRADRSSSCGSTPIIRSTAFAVPLSTTISGLNSIVDTRIGVTTILAVSSGSAMAMFLGTSSPNTIDSTVATISPNSAPTDLAATARPARSPPASGGDQIGQRGLHDEAQRQGGDGDADLRAGQLGRQRAQADHQRPGAAVTLRGLLGDGRPVGGDQAELGGDVQCGAGDQDEADANHDPLRDHLGCSRQDGDWIWSIDR